MNECFNPGTKPIELNYLKRRTKSLPVPQGAESKKENCRELEANSGKPELEFWNKNETDSLSQCEVL